MRAISDKCLENDPKNRPTFEQILADVGKSKVYGKEMQAAEKESELVQERLRNKMQIMEEMGLAHEIKMKKANKKKKGKKKKALNEEEGSDEEGGEVCESGDYETAEGYKKLRDEVEEISKMSQRTKKTRFETKGGEIDDKQTKEEFLRNENKKIKEQIEKLQEEMDGNIEVLEEMHVNRISRENVRRGSLSEVSNPFANIKVE